MIINIMVYFHLPVEGLRDLTLTSVLLFAEIFEFVTEWFQKKSYKTNKKPVGAPRGGGVGGGCLPSCRYTQIEI
jgi:hypothetical protein